jgi:hypothetical protein
MAGVKGRSGRRPLLADSKIEEILQVSHKILVRWLGNKEISDAKKIPVIAQLIGKRVPNKVDAEVLAQEGNKIVIVYPQAKEKDPIDARTKVQTEALSA